MPKSLLTSVIQHGHEKTAQAGSDTAVVKEIESEVTPPLKLNPRSGADVETARLIKKAKELSESAEGKPPVA